MKRSDSKIGVHTKSSPTFLIMKVVLIDVEGALRYSSARPMKNELKSFGKRSLRNRKSPVPQVSTCLPKRMLNQLPPRTKIDASRMSNQIGRSMPSTNTSPRNRALAISWMASTLRRKRASAAVNSLALAELRTTRGATRPSTKPPSRKSQALPPDPASASSSSQSSNSSQSSAPASPASSMGSTSPAAASGVAEVSGSATGAVDGSSSASSAASSPPAASAVSP